MKKRFLALFLALVMALALLPAPALAANPMQYCEGDAYHSEERGQVIAEFSDGWMEEAEDEYYGQTKIYHLPANATVTFHLPEDSEWWSLFRCNGMGFNVGGMKWGIKNNVAYTQESLNEVIKEQRGDDYTAVDTFRCEIMELWEMTEGAYLFVIVFDRKTETPGSFTGKVVKVDLPQYKEGLPLSDKLMAVRDGSGKYGFIDKAGKEVAPCKYDHIKGWSDGLVIVRMTSDWAVYKYGVIDETGKEVVPCKYDEIRLYDGLRIVGMDSGKKDEYGQAFYKFGIIDETGKEVVPCKYDEIGGFSDGLITVMMDSGKKDEYGRIAYKYGLIDRTGKEVVPCKYDEISKPSDGLIKVGVDTGEKDEYGLTAYKYGVIDRTGKEIAELKYDYVEILSGGYAQVQLDGKYGLRDGQWGIINSAGEEIVKLGQGVSGVFDGCVKISKLNDAGKRQYGFVDGTGREVVPCQYDDAGNFFEGLAAVCANGKWGIVDKTGREVIAPQYDDIAVGVYGKSRVFYEGLAAVCVNGKWGVIDKTGKEIVAPKYDTASVFSGGVLPVGMDGGEKSFDGYKTKVYRWGLIDSTGKEVLPCSLVYVRMKPDSEDGLFATEVMAGDAGNSSTGWSPRLGLVDKTGAVILPAECESIKVLGENLIAASFDSGEKNEWGGSIYTWSLFDKSGKAISGRQYSRVEQVSEGLIQVQTKDGKYGYVDQNGAELIAPKYDSVNSSSESGLIQVKMNGKYGAVNSDGKEIAAPQYSYVNFGNNGLVVVTLDGKQGLLDENGSTILPTEYESINLNSEKNANGLAACRKDGKLSVVSITPAGAAEPEKPATAAELGLTVTGWAKAEVDDALAAGLYDEALGKDMTIGITRAQAAAVAVKLYEAMKGAAMPEKENPFTDTEDPNVIKAYSLGLIDGNGSGKFGPDDPLNREAVAVMLSKVYRKLGGTIPAASTTTFADNGKISSWAKAEVSFMAEKGIVKGNGTSFNPQGPITGQEALILGLHMMNTLGQ